MMNLLLYILCGGLIVGQIWGIFWPDPLPFYVHDAGILALLVGGGLTLRTRKPVRPQLVKPLLLFTVVGFISLLLNSGRFSLVSAFESFLYLARWVAYGVVYLVCVQPYIKKTALLTGLIWAGIGLTTLGFIQYFWYPDLRNLMYLGWDPHLGRMFGSLLDPNFLGIVLVMMIFITWYAYEHSRKFEYVAVVFLELIALFLTYSRGSILALAAGVLVFSVVRKQKIILVAFCLIIPVGIWLLPKTGYEGTKLDRITSVTARFGNVERAWPLFTAAPILGWGFNTTRALALNERWWDIAAPATRASGSIDNSFLVILVTTGLVGLSIYGWLFLRMFGLGKSLLPTDLPLGSMYIAVLVAVVVHCQFINSLFYPWVMLPLWLLTAYVEKSLSKHT
jgi:hypothetical protein